MNFVPPFVGELSADDARLLTYMAGSSANILEFGCGGSTMIMAQIAKRYQRIRTIYSVETDPEWIHRTSVILQKLGCPVVTFMRTHNWQNHIPLDLKFDLIFIDNAPNERLPSAEQAWLRLKDDGRMVFHDTRRHQDARNAMDLVKKYHSAVSSVQLNPSNSNLTIVQKQPKIDYIDWNEAEGKQPWQCGRGEIPEEFFQGGWRGD